MNTESRFPLIGDPAPAFRAMTTQGKINFPEDYRGKWVVLFSHPADFTPVCTTEFIAFASLAEEFAKRNTQLVGLSIDSLHSHLAWLKSIESIDLNGQGSVSIPFPVIADISMSVAKKYGMLQTVANTQTVRAVFIIDAEGIVRTVLYYPMCTGRNMQEILRIVDSLQMHDSEAVSTPANWQPGDKVILGAPLTQEELTERLENAPEDVEVLTWYLAFKKLKEDK
ncbi:MAG: peroxiredoxin [Clostridiales bacterium]|nr:peroxiredoxin [Candidatus Cacconaster stercorequi]